jgi:CHAT domain-containing protein
LAGVTSCIVSLWDVPDKETVELMTEFYTRWNTTTGIHAAFSAAQQQLRKKYPDTPEKWAGFILIE